MKTPIRFYESFLALLDGNVSVSAALRVLSENTGDKTTQKMAREILSSMKKGGSFYEGAKIFLSSYHLPILRSAEATGDLPSAVRSILADLQRKEKAKDNIVNALVYPALIIMMSIAGTVFLLVKGIPLFAESGLMSGALVNNAVQGIIIAGLFLLVSGSAFIFAALKFFGSESPITRLFYLLSLLTSHHIPLSDALYYCVGALGQTKEAAALALIRKDIEAGSRVSEAFASQRSLCAPFVQNWLAVADTSGGVAEAFKAIYAYCLSRDDKRRALATRLIEPAAIIITGIYILLLLQAVVLPILTRAGSVL